MGAECFADYVEDVTRAAQAIPKPAFWIGHSLGGAAIYGAAATMRPLKCLGVIGLGAVFPFGKGNLTMKTLCKISHKLRHISSSNSSRLERDWGEAFCRVSMGFGYFRVHLSLVWMVARQHRTRHTSGTLTERL